MSAEKKIETHETKKMPTKKASRGPLFGTLLLVTMLIAVIAVLASFVWGGYQGFRLNKERETLVSISTLSSQADVPKEEVTPKEAVPLDTETAVPNRETEVLVKAKTTDIKVLNGGAAKGSATTTTDFLKKEGFTKVTVSNTLGNYTGTIIYFGEAFEKEAEATKDILVKSFPKIEIKAAVKGNAETSQGALTIILGK